LDGKLDLFLEAGHAGSPTKKGSVIAVNTIGPSLALRLISSQTMQLLMKAVFIGDGILLATCKYFYCFLGLFFCANDFKPNHIGLLF